MNVPPTDGIRVAVTDLEQLVVENFQGSADTRRSRSAHRQ